MVNTVLLAFGPYDSSNSSNTPVSAKDQQGPHQVANKSSRTGLPSSKISYKLWVTPSVSVIVKSGAVEPGAN